MSVENKQECILKWLLLHVVSVESLMIYNVISYSKFLIKEVV